MTSSTSRYAEGGYDVDFGDDDWKAEQMAHALKHIPDPASVKSYADVGCGNGGVFSGIRDRLVRSGFPIQRAVGYDVIPEEKVRAAGRPELVFKRVDFFADDEHFDLITLNDVVEHVVSPQRFLEGIAPRARYVALHIPLDDRLSVLMTNQYNFRIGPVGHLSFLNPATALNLLTASGLTPFWCGLTPGFMAASGRVRLIQRVAFLFRWMMWHVNPGLMAKTIGGASLAVVCRGGRE
jgi:SAM-dependent methyltransferase